MDYFNDAVEYVLEREGGWVDNANDPGGATNYGISLRFLREISNERLRKYGIFVSAENLSPADIKNLTREQAILIYKGEFWDAAPFEKMADSQLINYVFDMCVDSGISTGIKLLQRAIWGAHEQREFAGILDDGILGDKTLQEIELINGYDLRTALVVERAAYMHLVAALNPKEKEFLNGWLDRCYRFL